jgi:hypothetical protein
MKISKAKTIIEQLEKDLIKDSNGKPKLFYRGTVGKNNLQTRIGLLSFTDNEGIARVYSSNLKVNRNTFEAEAEFQKESNVGIYYLSMSDPIEIKEESGSILDFFNDYFSGFKSNKPKLLEMLKYIDDRESGRIRGPRFEYEFKYDSSIVDNDTFMGVEIGPSLNSLYRTVSRNINDNEFIEEALDSLIIDYFVLIDSPAFIDIAKKYGCDGVIHKDPFGMHHVSMKLINRKLPDSHMTYRPFELSQVIPVGKLESEINESMNVLERSSIIVENMVRNLEISRDFLKSKGLDAKKINEIISQIDIVDPFPDKRFALQLAKKASEGKDIKQYKLKIENLRKVARDIDTHPVSKWKFPIDLPSRYETLMDIKGMMRTIRIDEIDDVIKEAEKFMDLSNYRDDGLEIYDTVDDGDDKYVFYKIKEKKDMYAPIMLNACSYCIMKPSHFGLWGDVPYYIVMKYRKGSGIPKMYAAITPNSVLVKITGPRNDGEISYSELDPIRSVAAKILKDHGVIMNEANINTWKSLSDITPEDVLDYFSSPMFDQTMMMYPEDGGDYDDESYHFKTKEEAIAYASDTIDFFKSLPDPVPVWRAIKVKSTDEIDMEYGDSWSFSKDSAIEFGSHNGSNALLSGKAPKRFINWPITIGIKIHFSKCEDSESENEIRIDSYNVQDIKHEKISKTKM